MAKRTPRAPGCHLSHGKRENDEHSDREQPPVNKEDTRKVYSDPRCQSHCEELRDNEAHTDERRAAATLIERLTSAQEKAREDEDSLPVPGESRCQQQSQRS
jgi:hypothetical protein